MDEYFLESRYRDQTWGLRFHFLVVSVIVIIELRKIMVSGFARLVTVSQIFLCGLFLIFYEKGGQFLLNVFAC